MHQLMLLESLVGVAVAMFAEPGHVALRITSLAALLHAATGQFDLRLALASERRVTVGELRLHSLLELLPFVVVGLLCFGTSQTVDHDTRLRRRSPPLPRLVRDLGLGMILLTGAIPYAEELARCLRTRRAH